MFLKRKNKLVVLGIDGVPYSFIKEGIDKGIYPNIKSICEENVNLKRYNSVYPTVSSVAWTSYMTGKNPGEHSIFGFVDRTVNPFKLKIPLSGDRTSKTLWKIASENGKKVLIMNVPLTYPPEEVNGILISGFLSTDVKKCVYPNSLAQYLIDRDYVIDVDPRFGHTDREKFMRGLFRALDIRMEVFHDLISKESYDIAQCHIMETDRINHFFWNDYITGGEFREDFDKFYRKLDEWIGKTYSLLNDKDKFIVLSDHGFCEVKYNVQLNHLLEENGYLSYNVETPRDITELSQDSKAYSLIPGRIFINLKGREERGSVSESEYDQLREELKEKLFLLKSPENKPIIKEVFYREEIYNGPYLDHAADLIVHPHWGFDIKGNVKTGKLCHKSKVISGMHTYEDALIFGKNVNLENVNSIQDPLRIILDEW